MAHQEFPITHNEVVVGRNNNSIKLQSICEGDTSLEAKCFLSLAEMDSEDLEKELDSLLQDSAKDPVHLHPVPPKEPDSGFVGAILDAELEAELEKLSVCDEGMGVSRPC